MAKVEVAVGKRLKISKSQKTMLGAVAIASLILGVSLVFSVYFLKNIKFNSRVISAKSKAIDNYSDAIATIGICKSPIGSVYTVSELESCEPDDIDVSLLGESTLRHNVIYNLSQNENLESVARTGLSICFDSATNKKVSVSDLIESYRMQTDEKERAAYLERISMCSALRVIPDALPSSPNALAVGASLNRLFTISGYSPESITTGDVTESSIPGVGAININLEIEDSAEVTLRALNNIERSIREFNIKSARIERNYNKLKVEAVAEAYFTEAAELNEVVVTVPYKGAVSEQGSDSIEEEN
ncbi:hypothetical protein IKG31_03215 [Candidatus Saccharibacteria bacterium]|nr:hypothetical protein [Candidatus Saccharibacteria bacterium]